MGGRNGALIRTEFLKLSLQQKERRICLRDRVPRVDPFDLSRGTAISVHLVRPPPKTTPLHFEAEIIPVCSPNKLLVHLVISGM